MTAEVAAALRKALEAARRVRIRGPFEVLEETEVEETEPSRTDNTTPAPQTPLRPS